MSEPNDKLDLDGDSAVIGGQAGDEGTEIKREKVAVMGRPDPSPQLGDRVISVVLLRDARYAVKNERDVSELTAEDEDQMANALLLWFGVRRRMRGDA